MIKRKDSFVKGTRLKRKKPENQTLASEKRELFSSLQLIKISWWVLKKIESKDLGS
jgi:hypothetical protein